MIIQCARLKVNFEIVIVILTSREVGDALSILTSMNCFRVNQRYCMATSAKMIMLELRSLRILTTNISPGMGLIIYVKR